MSTTVADLVETDDEIDAALDRALADPGVTVIGAHVSRDVPPLPAHITREYALNADVAAGPARGGGATATAGADVYWLSVTTALMALAMITAPNRYEMNMCRSIADLTAELRMSVSDTWNVMPTVKARYAKSR